MLTAVVVFAFRVGGLVGIMEIIQSLGVGVVFVTGVRSLRGPGYSAADAEWKHGDVR